ncbi:hypothetical protein ABZP36_034837 [Zizania latifolia]
MMQRNCDYIIVINDDESDEGAGKEDEVNSMHLKSPKLDTIASTLRKPDKESKLERGKRCKVDKKSLAALKGNGKENEGNDGNSSSILVNGNTELVKRVLSTKMLYYVRPFALVKDPQDTDARGKNADEKGFQPRRELGVEEMVREASEAWRVQKVELETTIDNLKEEIVVLEVQFRDRNPSKT